MKYFRMSYEEVLYKRSYLNITLLNRSIPTYGDDRGDKKIPEDNKKENKQEHNKIDKDIHAANFFLGMMGG